MKHDHGNDGPVMPASVAHRGRDLFDHSHEGEERGGGHQHHQDHHHHQSPVDAPDPQDGLVAVVGGSAIAAGGGTTVPRFFENISEKNGPHSNPTGAGGLHASAYSSEPRGPAGAAPTFLAG